MLLCFLLGFWMIPSPLEGYGRCPTLLPAPRFGDGGKPSGSHFCYIVFLCRFCYESDPRIHETGWNRARTYVGVPFSSLGSNLPQKGSLPPNEEVQSPTRKWAVMGLTRTKGGGGSWFGWCGIGPVSGSILRFRLLAHVPLAGSPLLPLG